MEVDLGGKVVSLSCGEVEVKRFSLKDFFLFSKIISTAIEKATEKTSTTNEGFGALLIASLPYAENDIYALISSLTGIDKPDELLAEDILKIVDAVVEQEDFSNFFTKAKEVGKKLTEKISQKSSTS